MSSPILVRVQDLLQILQGLSLNKALRDVSSINLLIAARTVHMVNNYVNSRCFNQSNSSLEEF
jgi:hypothetical protein